MGKNFIYASKWAPHGGSPGLDLLSFDSETGAVNLVSRENGEFSFNRSFVDSSRNILYVCNEDEKYPGVSYPTGSIFGYSIDRDTGHLTELFRRVTMCPSPDYISMDPSGEYLVVSHHSTMDRLTIIEQDENGRYFPRLQLAEAVVELYEVGSNGIPGELLDVKKHEPVKLRRHPYGHLDGCHPHSAVFSPDGKLISVCDKGDGYVYIYTIDRENRRLKLLSRTFSDSSVSFNTPRYCVFHPTEPYLIVNHERLSDGCLNVCSFRYDKNGNLTPVGRANALSPDFEIPDGMYIEQQGLCLSADGTRLYTAIHGPDMIGVLSVGKDGSLSLMENVPVPGKWVRGIALSPDGRFVVAGCLNGGGVFSYAIRDDGTLSPTGFSADLPGVSYLTFM